MGSKWHGDHEAWVSCNLRRVALGGNACKQQCLARAQSGRPMHAKGLALGTQPATFHMHGPPQQGASEAQSPLLQTVCGASCPQSHVLGMLGSSFCPCCHRCCLHRRRRCWPPKLLMAAALSTSVVCYVPRPLPPMPAHALRPRSRHPPRRPPPLPHPAAPSLA